MRALYTTLLYLLLPVILLRLLWRSLRAPAYRRRWSERFGRFPLRLHDAIWIHAVSVGEVQAAESLVKRLRQQFPQLPLVITTTTPTGADRVQKLFADSVSHLYLPYDIPFAVNGFIERIQPRILLMMETEVWPNILASCWRRKIPAILANARLSARSQRNYQRLGSFTETVFGQLSLVATQSAVDAERFHSLGVPKERIEVTGSIKFDIHLPPSLLEQAEVLRRQWGGRQVWVAASTHEGEDEQIIAAHLKILQQFPAAMLVLVPRHPERFDRVAGLCSRQGLKIARRSSGERPGADVSVFIGDSMGELTQFIAAADVAFVGGSLVPVGGHNILEPAALGVPILFGPYMFNFALISQMLLTAGAAVQVADAAALAETVSEWFGDASERARIGELGRMLVEQNRGALDRLYALVEVRLADAGRNSA